MPAILTGPPRDGSWRVCHDPRRSLVSRFVEKFYDFPQSFMEGLEKVYENPLFTADLLTFNTSNGRRGVLSIASLRRHRAAPFSISCNRALQHSRAERL
jgi:hypothetical protein